MKRSTVDVFTGCDGAMEGSHDGAMAVRVSTETRRRIDERPWRVLCEHVLDSGRTDLASIDFDSP